MIIDCIFDIIDVLFSTVLDKIGFELLQIRVFLGFLINVAAFVLISVLYCAPVQNTASLVLFIFILFFIITTFFFTCLYILISAKTKCCYRLTSKLEKCVESLKEEGLLMYFVLSELLVSYKHHELFFDVLLFLYGFAVSNWSPEKDTVCIIALGLSAADLVWNFCFTVYHVYKLINLKIYDNPYPSYWRILFMIFTMFKRIYPLWKKFWNDTTGKNNWGIFTYEKKYK